MRSALALLLTEELTSARWSSPNWEQILPIADLQEDAAWSRMEVEVLPDRMSPQGRSVANYAFTEMLNNAIDPF